jgi:GPI ethanolamine phosphate transferase 3 subunit O
MQVNSSVLFAFRADPPTTTVQRVKALLSGSLPTFLDVGTVFAGSRLEEDNVFYQAMRSGMLVGAVGDDTWEQLFPRQSSIALNISRPFPSLNVKDLHTVDDGVAHVCFLQL